MFCPPGRREGNLSIIVMWQEGRRWERKYAVVGPAILAPIIRILRSGIVVDLSEGVDVCSICVLSACVM